MSLSCTECATMVRFEGHVYAVKNWHGIFFPACGSCVGRIFEEEMLPFYYVDGLFPSGNLRLRNAVFWVRAETMRKDLPVLTEIMT